MSSPPPKVSGITASSPSLGHDYARYITTHPQRQMRTFTPKVTMYKYTEQATI